MEELLSKLKIYLDDEDLKDDKLLLLLEQATSKVVRKRYPFGATDTQKASALTAYSDVLLDVAIYLYNMQGAEGEKSHSENGINRNYNPIDDLLSDVVSVCKISSNTDTATTTTT